MANRIKFVGRSYTGFFHPILTWEYHCFGYRTGGHSSTKIHDGYENNYSWTDDTHVTVTSTEKSHMLRIAYFKRHEEYPTNPIFAILELLMGIVSRIRVAAGKFFIAAYILFSYILADIGLEHLGETAGNIALAIYACSFIIPIIGLVVRKAFGLDQKIDDICQENGWQKWSQYDDE